MRKGLVSAPNYDEWVVVRGIPVARWEIVQLQDRLGAQLFDESLFKEQHKRLACANVITALDRRLRYMQELAKDPSYIPDSVDIGDVSWLYIPVSFAGFTTVRTKKFPAGVVGWFRFKKYFTTGGHKH